MAGCMGYTSNTPGDRARLENLANAALIVKSVNFHDELVGALETAMGVMEADHKNLTTDRWDEDYVAEAAQIEAVLAKVRAP